jgi:hypothetical protein
MYDGWTVAGINRVLLSIVLALMFSIIFGLLDIYVEDVKKYLTLRYKRSKIQEKGVDKSEH